MIAAGTQFQALGAVLRLAIIILAQDNRTTPLHDNIHSNLSSDYQRLFKHRKWSIILWLK